MPKSIRVHRKAFRAMQLLAYPRALSLSKIFQFFDINCGLFMRLQIYDLMAQAGGEKNAALIVSFNLRMLSASIHAVSRAHRSCHSPFRLFLRPIHWYNADEDNLGKSFQAMDFCLEC